MRLIWLILWIILLWILTKAILRFINLYNYRRKMQSKLNRQIIDIDYEEIKDEKKSEN